MQKPSNDTLRQAVVVGASCFLSFLFLGTVRLSGQLFLACRERFNVGRREAALPFVLAYTLKHLSGPFVGYLGNKLGLRCVTLLGCAVSAISLGACYLAEDIITFTVLWGGFLGIGFGMGVTLIVNILHLCFKKDFNKVQGLFLASGCIGAFVLPGITEYLMKTYGISGTFLILSGLLLHSIPATMLLKVPEKCRQIKIQLEIKELYDTKGICKNIETISIEDISHFENREVTIQQTSQTKSNSPVAKNKEMVEFPGLPNDYTAQKSNKANISCRSSYVTEDTHFSETNELSQVEDLKGLSNRSIIVSDKESQKEIPGSEKYFDASDDKKNTNYLAKSHRQSKSTSRNFQVFLDPAYILILISLSSSTIVVITMYTVIVDSCRDKGITEDVTVLMTFAITEMVGRLIFGYMADGGCISPLNIYALCCGCCGLFMIIYIWLDNFYVVLVFISGIGALMGAMVGMSPGIITNYIKKEDITMALSSRYVLFGLLNLPQPLVIGYFRETLHSYAGLCYLLGSMCLLSAIITLLIPPAARLRDRMKS